MLLVYKLETSKNFKEVKPIMIIAITYIFFNLIRYLINSLKLLSEKPQDHLKKSFTHSPLPKNLESASPPPFWQNGKFFSPPPHPHGRKEGGHYETCWFFLALKLVNSIHVLIFTQYILERYLRFNISNKS